MGQLDAATEKGRQFLQMVVTEVELDQVWPDSPTEVSDLFLFTIRHSLTKVIVAEVHLAQFVHVDQRGWEL